MNVHAIGILGWETAGFVPKEWVPSFVYLVEWTFPPRTNLHSTTGDDESPESYKPWGSKNLQTSGWRGGIHCEGYLRPVALVTSVCNGIAQKEHLFFCWQRAAVQICFHG